MAFLPTEILVRDSSTIQLKFSSNPSPFIGPTNFAIESSFSGNPDLTIRSVTVNGNVVTIDTRPQFPNNLYLIRLLDASGQPFVDVNGDVLSHDDNSRNIYFVGVEDANTIRDNMLSKVTSIYDVGQDTIIRDLISAFAIEAQKAKTSIGETESNNFISVPVIDELYFRGTTPTDRLQNEGAYQVLRVGKTPTGNTFFLTLTYDPIADNTIPFEVQNLRATTVTERLSNSSTTSTFDGFILTVSHPGVIKLNTAKLNTYRNPDGYNYNPSLFGYALLNNNFDKLARQYLGIASNQIRLSILSQTQFPEPVYGDTVDVTYQYDNTGRIVDRSSISLYSIFHKVNEQVNVGVTIFLLSHANVVDQNGNPVTSGGVQFHNAPNDHSLHPAFIKEIAFRTSALPSQPGQYAINYTTGEVYVYGTLTEIGTGSNPPVATYYYKSIGAENSDYFVNDDGSQLTINPLSNFAINKFFVSFNYEDVMVNGVDYISASHNEVLNERVQNRLVDTFKIKTLNNQLKEILQIKNETTGELYAAGFVEDNVINFTGSVAPATSSTTNEVALFSIVDGEVLNVVATDVNISPFSLKIFEIAFKNKPILSARSFGIGASFDSSVIFSTNNIFLNEYYFNADETLVQNITKLHSIGDYLIDYSNGFMYVAVNPSQPFDVGHASYSYGSISVQHQHVLSVENVKRAQSPDKPIKSFEAIFDDTTITPKNLDYAYERFDGVTIVDNTNSIFACQLQDDFTLYTKYPIQNLFSVFTQADVDGYDASTLVTRNVYNPEVHTFSSNKIDLKTYAISTIIAGTGDFIAVIPEQTTVVKSIIKISNGQQLLDKPIYLIKQKNIVMTSAPVNSIGTSVVTITNNITLLDTSHDYFVDITGRRFPISSIAGNQLILNTTVPSTNPYPNLGSSILTSALTTVAEHLNIINVTEVSGNQSLLTYDFLPTGLLAGYIVKDASNNMFKITGINQAQNQVTVLNNDPIMPVIDPVAFIETDSLLIQNNLYSTTELHLPLDAPVQVGDSLQIGYVPIPLNNIILQANGTGSAGGAGMLVSYSSGQYFADYTHLDDELLVSYEWGDNQLDWSISDTLKAGDPYFVTYNYGASRTALEINFGSLTNVDFLQIAPLTLNREVYRSAVQATLAAFVKGPTREAITIIAKAFSQVDPLIVEDVVNQWVVGRDPLKLEDPTYTGELVFGNGRYNEGILVTNNNSIQVPGVSNLRLLEGTFSTWVKPNWAGTQCDAPLTINLPTAIKTVYYNAGGYLPQNVPIDDWILDPNSIGTAYADTFLHSHNVKYINEKTRGQYKWNRLEETLSLVNDLDILITGSVPKLHFVDTTAQTIDVLTAQIDDGYGIYTTGFILEKQKTYYETLIVNQVHLSINSPYPHSDPADPPSLPGTSSMVGEVHLNDHLGTRPPGTTIPRTNGWEKQLYAEIGFSPAIPTWYIDIHSEMPPLSPQVPALDRIEFIIPGTDVLVDAYGSVFEIDHLTVDGYMWIKKPAADGADVPAGNVTIYRRTVGIKGQDGKLIASIPTNWSNVKNINFTKRGGVLSISVDGYIDVGSYNSHFVNNSVSPGITMGQLQSEVEATIELRSLQYSIYPILTKTDVYIGSIGQNPTNDVIQFMYDPLNDGAPALNINKYMAIYTNAATVGTNEKFDQDFIKFKIPSSWNLFDGYITTTFTVNPKIDFTIETDGDTQYITEFNGMNFYVDDKINLSLIDLYTRVPGLHSVLSDIGPEIRIAVGKKHYILDIETDSGSIEIYRGGNGFLNAKVVAENKVYNIKSYLDSWAAGQAHHIGLSWRFNTPDHMDELHLFIDGDEVSNEISTGAILPLPTQYSQIYEEQLTIVPITLLDGYIINNATLYPDGGLLVPMANIQPDNSWLDRTIVLKSLSIGELDCQPSAPGINLNMPLIVSSFAAATIDGYMGTIVTFSSNGKIVNFNQYTGSVPIKYGFATNTTVNNTLLTRTNFGLFLNGVELIPPSGINPEYRQVGDSQIIELYTLDGAGQYAEVALNNLCVPLTGLTVRTFGLLSYRVKERIFQFGKLHRNQPITLDTLIDGVFTSTAYSIVNGLAAFMTDLPEPVDINEVKITKVLLPRIVI